MARPPPHLERFLAGHGLPSQVPQGQGDRLRPCPTLSRSMIAWTWTSSISMGCGSSGVPWSCQCVTVLLPYVVEDAAGPGSSSPPPPARTAPGTGRTPLPRPSCCCAYPWHRSFLTSWSQHPERSGEEPSNDQVRHKTPGHTGRRPHSRGAAPLSFVHHRSRPDRPAPATRDRPRSRAALLVGWGQIPDQYGRELDGDDGEVREEPRRWSGRDRSGGGPARRMLTAALEAEVEAYVAAHLLDRDENGRVPPGPQRGPLQDVVDASRYRHRQLRSWHGRKANQPPRAVQTGDRVTGPV